MLQPAQAITPISSATATFNFSDVSTTELLTALVSMSVGTPFDLNPDDQLQLDITPSGGGIAIRERESATDANMSRIELATSTVINVDSVTFSPVNAAPGNTVTITTVISDPFGEDDITGVNTIARDRLAYRITLVESGGVAKSSVRVVDPAPANTTLDSGSLLVCVDTAPPSSCTPLAAGIGCINNSTATTIDVSGITVPANGEVRVEFDVIVNGSVAAGDLISNEATITAPGTVLIRDSQDLVVFGAPLSSGAKYLFFDNADQTTKDLTRLVPDTNTETDVIIGASGDSVTFFLTPALTKSLTVTNESDNTNREIIIHIRDGSAFSEVDMEVTPVINVDSFTFHTDTLANGGGALVTNPNPGGSGVTLYAGVVVSDPFGEGDIES